MLVTSLSLSNLSLLYHQSNNSENLPGGSGFIPQDRFTYLTVGIISVTLLLGILFPQSKYHVNKQNTRSSFCSSVTAFSCYCLVAFPCIKTKRKHKLLKKNQRRAGLVQWWDQLLSTNVIGPGLISWPTIIIMWMEFVGSRLCSERHNKQ